MSSAQASFPVAPSTFNFNRCGKAGSWISNALPHIGSMADDLCIIRSMHTDAINHDPAITFQQTGSQIPGRPSIGSWVGYGLGSNNDNLPAFVALSSRGSGKAGQPLYDRLWGSGFLPAQYGGVQFRNAGDPVLFVSNPPGVSSTTRRELIDSANELNRMALGNLGDPAIAAQIENYELAFRMQSERSTN